ncbi:MAG: LLM class flavin-dependent oxidoreductase [Micrococcaceae bacterium]
MTTTIPVTPAAHFRLGVALKDSGWAEDAPGQPSSPTAWLESVRTAEQAGLAFATLHDAFRFEGVARFDAALLGSWLAAGTQRIGLLPTVTTTHTEPFHVSKAIATLDYIGTGRAGWVVEVSPTAEEAQLFGRDRTDLAPSTLYAEAQEVVEVVRRLWDSWEDDAEIRDAATGRFIDREKLHYINYESPRFSVKGPSITPRPPQGQPVVAYAGHTPEHISAALQGSDVLFAAPRDLTEAEAIIQWVRRTEAAEHSPRTPLVVYADVPVRLGTRATASAGAEDWGTGEVLTSVERTAERLRALRDLGFAGARLLPADHATDLEAVHDELVPALHQLGILDPADASPSTLREVFGLGPAVNRYAQPATASSASAASSTTGVLS